VTSPRADDEAFRAAVARRLEHLRELHVPERDEDARKRLVAEQPLFVEPFARAVERRLAELRALMELTRHLHSAGLGRKKPTP
jgi:hypothetical protein